MSNEIIGLGLNGFGAKNDCTSCRCVSDEVDDTEVSEFERFLVEERFALERWAGNASRQERVVFFVICADVD